MNSTSRAEADSHHFVDLDFMTEYFCETKSTYFGRKTGTFLKITEMIASKSLDLFFTTKSSKEVARIPPNHLPEQHSWWPLILKDLHRKKHDFDPFI